MTQIQKKDFVEDNESLLRPGDSITSTSDFSEIAPSLNEISHLMVKIKQVDKKMTNSSKDIFSYDNRQPTDTSNSGTNKGLPEDQIIKNLDDESSDEHTEKEMAQKESFECSSTSSIQNSNGQLMVRSIVYN